MTRRSPLLPALGGSARAVADSVRILEEQPALPSKTVAQLQAWPAPIAGQLAYASNESGGAQPVFYDGANWRRMTDRAVIS